MTFINGEKVEKAVLTILNMSWNAYEKYTSPLGIGWMVEPHTHYGPNVDGYEYSKWGTYHKADHHAIGIDRTTTGTKYTSQYHVSNKSKYDSINTCDEKLLLFFHRIRYDHKLKSGQTLIQYIYDSHFEGVEDVIRMKDLWKGTKGFVNPNIFKQVLDLLENQKTSAIEWRDVVNSYFFRKTGIRDNLNRTIYL
jgi:alpha-glucuronidase